MSQHDYETIAALARDKARESIHQGNPDRAQAWIAAAAEADRAQRPAPELRIVDGIERTAEALIRLADALIRLTDRVNMLRFAELQERQGIDG